MSAAKNPFLSAWLAEANRTVNRVIATGRVHAQREASRQARRFVAEGEHLMRAGWEAGTDMWLAAWAVGSDAKPASARRRTSGTSGRSGSGRSTGRRSTGTRSTSSGSAKRARSSTVAGTASRSKRSRAS